MYSVTMSFSVTLAVLTPCESHLQPAATQDTRSARILLRPPVVSCMTVTCCWIRSTALDGQTGQSRDVRFSEPPTGGPRIGRYGKRRGGSFSSASDCETNRS